MNGIGRIIDMLISSGRSGNVSLDSDGLLECLAKSEYKLEDEPDYKPEDESKRKHKRWWLIPYQKGLRLVLVISAAVMMITVIIYYGVRYLNDVILFENQLTINEQGAFNPRKSLNCEYALFLFNTAELWANSGILVNEKDRIRINISGGYNSWVDGAVVAAQDNKGLTYPWVRYDKNNDPDRTPGIDLCVDTTFGFGSAMYAIAPESQSLKSDPLQLITEEEYKWWQSSKENSNWHGSKFLWKIGTSNKFHKAGRTGTLFFAVNDMYFQNNKTMIDYYSKAEDAHGKPYTAEQIEAFKNRPTQAYDDNLGQLLVSVEIQRFVPNYFFYPTMAYRFLEYNMNETLDSDYWYVIKNIVNKLKLNNIIKLKANKTLIKIANVIIKCILCLWWFAIFSIWISLLFAFYMIALMVIVYLLFFIFGGDWLLRERRLTSAKSPEKVIK